ncbi:MAG TPA: VWA domain-containing protein [Solirubrobacteraceae bacterium]|nr:VWA domain-containing protein [Solirubrobacteraceae bacterium]
MTVTTPATNPTSTLPCGLKVALVLDESASINATDAAHVRAAANGFVSALSGTGATVAIIAFAQRARTGVPYTEVTPTTIGSTFSPFINGTSSPSFLYPPATLGTRSGTNWQGAFNQVTTLGDLPNLVVFVTDGDPNGTNSTTSFTTSLDGGVDVMTPAVAAADALKDARTRVFAIGVGEAVSNEASKSRLTAVSGPTEFTGIPPHDVFTTSDWTTVDFDQLKDKLTGIVGELCEGSLTITKWESTPNGTGWIQAPARDWEFAATLMAAHGHRWLHPSIGDGNPARLFTDSHGTARFEWELTHPEESTLTVVRENSKPDFNFVYAVCEVHNRDTTLVGEPVRTDSPIIEGLTVPPRGYVTCSAYNQRKAAHLTVIKHLVPDNDPGRFDLLVDGNVWKAGAGNLEGTGRLTLALGTHTVSEAAAGGTDLADYSTSIVCRNGTTVVAGPSTNTSISVDLRSETDDIVCTITNTNIKFGDLTVIKHVVPSDAPGSFNLLVDGTEHATNVTDGGSTGPIRLPFGSYEVSETAGTGTDLADFSSEITCIDEHGTEVASGPGPSLSVSLESASIECTITNTHIPPPEVVHLKVVKRLAPSDDPGLFDLLVDGTAFAQAVSDGGTTGTLDFAIGTYKVSERVTAGEAHAISLDDYSISTACINEANGKKIASGTGPAPVSVRLKSGANVVCTITNTRTVVPPPEPPTPPEECRDVVDGVAECGDLARAPVLSVVKQMPTSARVGDRVSITITVKNVGHETARQVRLHETPPAGGRIVGVADHGALQSDGTVIWNLGDLAPGEKRTVHATLLVTGTGLQTDTAVAAAANADPGVDVATVRAATALRPPPFTG